MEKAEKKNQLMLNIFYVFIVLLIIGGGYYYYTDLYTVYLKNTNHGAVPYNAHGSRLE